MIGRNLMDSFFGKKKAQEAVPEMTQYQGDPIPYVYSGRAVTIFTDGAPKTVDSSHPNYNLILTALKEQRWRDAGELVNMEKAVLAYLKDKTLETGTVEVKEGQVYLEGERVHNVLTDRILNFMVEGLDATPLARFLENLNANPSRTAVQELYLFLESGNLPITPDGCFLAYKKVREDYYDIFSGSIRNVVGDVVSMKRNEVDDVRDRTCSYGLHFCSEQYLKHYGTSQGSRVMVVKINPRDVVSIPSDYNNTKGRTCRYVVVGELENHESVREMSQPYTDRWSNDEDDYEEFDEDLDHDWEECDEDYDYHDDGNVVVESPQTESRPRLN